MSGSRRPLLRDPQGKGRPPALFLDFDGTLVPLSSRPSDVCLSEAHALLLEKLARRFPTFVISGRGEADLLSRLPPVPLAGLSADHGAVRILTGERHLHPEAERARDLLPALAGRVCAEMEPISGILVERKEFSLSIHYRAVSPDQVEEARKRLDRLLSEMEALSGERRLRISEGKKVWEIRPARGVTKEESLEFFLEDLARRREEGSSFFPVMAGDDTTDLRAVNRAVEKGGQGIWVGPPPPGLNSQATVLSLPQDLWTALEELLSESPPPPPQSATPIG
ncbi:MAG: trehalose-phosphatase [Leptospirillia bacterium]